MSLSKDVTYSSFLSTSTIVLFHCYFMSPEIRYERISTFIGRLGQLSLLFQFFKSGNTKPKDLKDVYIRNVVIIGIHMLFSMVVQDSVFLEKLFTNPLEMIIRWYTMTLTLKTDTVDYLGKYMAHLWFLHNEFLFTVFTRLIPDDYVWYSFCATGLIKLICYRDIPSDFSISETHDFTQGSNLTRTNELKQFLYAQNYSPWANAWIFLLGYYLRTKNIILVSDKEVTRWSRLSYFGHIPLLYIIQPVIRNPYLSSFIINTVLIFCSKMTPKKIIY